MVKIDRREQIPDALRLIKAVKGVRYVDLALMLGVPFKTMQNWLYGAYFPKDEVLIDKIFQLEAECTRVASRRR